jgi:hypothetical protein
MGDGDGDGEGGGDTFGDWPPPPPLKLANLFINLNVVPFGSTRPSLLVRGIRPFETILS